MGSMLGSIFGTGSAQRGAKNAQLARSASSERAKDDIDTGYQRAMEWMNVPLGLAPKYQNELALRVMGDERTWSPDALMKGWQTDPGYDFRLQQGRDALSAKAAQTGVFGSGTLGTSLVDYSQQVASDEFGKVFGRRSGMWGDYLNRLTHGADMGQQAQEYAGTAAQNWGRARAGIDMYQGENAADYANTVGTTQGQMWQALGSMFDKSLAAIGTGGASAMLPGGNPADSAMQFQQPPSYFSSADGVAPGYMMQGGGGGGWVGMGGYSNSLAPVMGRDYPEYGMYQPNQMSLL